MGLTSLVRDGRPLALAASLLVAACAANAEPPLTAAEKERLIQDYAAAEALRQENDPALPVACKTSTGAVRSLARAGSGLGVDGFGSEVCPAGTPP